MYAFVDESGVQKTLGYTVVIAVFIKTADLQAVEQQVLSAEKAAGKAAMHWTETAWPSRIIFINGIASANFAFREMLIKNPVGPTEAAVETALINLLGGVKVSRLYIDGVKNKNYERRLKKVLRDKGATTKILKTVNDKRYPAIRLADALAGLIRFYHEQPDNKRASKLYKQILNHRLN